MKARARFSALSALPATVSEWPFGCLFNCAGTFRHTFNAVLGGLIMSTAEKAVLTSIPTHPLPSVHEPQPAPAPRAKPWWQKLAFPALVLALTAAIVVTITRNWNAWEGGRIEQVTDDAFVRGDVTPLSTKVAGIVRDVSVSDFQQVHKGDLLVALQDDDYSAQVAQAMA